MLELLVVLFILSMLALVGTPQVMKYLDKAKTDTARLQIESLSAALHLYKLEVGHYPTQEQGLEALLARPADEEDWNGPYVEKPEKIVDPWGTTFLYRFPGQRPGTFDLLTLGADSSVGGEGENADITN